MANNKTYGGNKMSFWVHRFKVKQYFIGIMIAMAIVMFHAGSTILNNWSFLDQSPFLFTPFTKWISIDSGPLTLFLFLSLPLLCCLSGSQIYIDDVESGFIWHVVQKKPLRKYILNIEMISFFSGLVTVFIPLLINYAILWFFLPYLLPNLMINENLTVLNTTSFFANTYYTNPLLFIVFYMLLPSFFGGIYALFSTMIACFTRKKFLSVTASFLFVSVLSVISGILPNIFYAPNLISIASSPVYLPNFMRVVSSCMILMSFICISITLGVKRYVNQ